MIGFIKGIITNVYEEQVVLENNGIGYVINISINTKNQIEKSNEEIKLFTHMQVREDDISLFGFFSIEEKRMFLNLISVSGIGPKAALTILSGLALNSLALAIVSEDTKSLSKIKGVGKKTAERIILELKEIISKQHNLSSLISPEDNNSDMVDAIEALCGLGISRSEAMVAVQNSIDHSNSLEELVINSLKKLNK
ncbi:MAG: Holliday junction branch migration protein RuvA [Clostridia bacterium]|jgi:Holliday junction DNA helicase RuvA|nr:Holliday junction branch migration protein RuvA [Clostridia bacterium]